LQSEHLNLQWQVEMQGVCFVLNMPEELHGSCQALEQDCICCSAAGVQQ